jgi:hypothetical protein
LEDVVVTGSVGVGSTIVSSSFVGFLVTLTNDPEIDVLPQ